MKLLIFFLLLTVTSSMGFSLPKNPLIDIFIRSKIPKQSPLKDTIEPRPSITTHWLEQRVNHFDPQNTHTFNQRFFLNDEFFQPSGPLIFYLHSYPFDETQQYYLSFGPVFDLAKELNGTIVLHHHRYFQESVVFDELTTENLRFLTVNQALEDLAQLIAHLRSPDTQYSNSNVIVVGWDYGGSMATWFAQKYPHMVTGTWSSGARLDPQLGHPEPVHLVESIMRLGGDECFNRIANGFRQFDEMLASGQSNIFRRRFNFCFPLMYSRGEFDVMYFYEVMVTIFYAYAQVYTEDILEESLCANLLNAPVEADWEAIGYIYSLLQIPMPLCYPNSVEFQLDLVRDNLHADSEISYAIAFMYLQCAEFGFFFNSGDGTSIFGSMFPSSFNVYVCQNLFGFTEAQMIQNYNLFNTMHGGRRPVVRNAYFTNGELNQWINQTIDQEAVHSTSFYEIIPGRSLYTELSLVLDEPMLEEVRQRVHAAIRQWLRIDSA